MVGSLATTIGNGNGSAAISNPTDGHDALSPNCQVSLFWTAEWQRPEETAWVGKWNRGIIHNRSGEREQLTCAWAVSMRRRASGRKRARRESTICLAAPPAPMSDVEAAALGGVGGSGGGYETPAAAAAAAAERWWEERGVASLRSRGNRPS